MADLAERLEVVPRAVTTLVDGLEARGSVRRVPDPTNRRVVRIELTDDRPLDAARPARRAPSAAEDILAPLSDQQRDALGGLLDNLSGPPGEPLLTGPRGGLRAVSRAGPSSR